jgi:hypothetical protein
MPLPNFSTENSILTINGRSIQDWGNTDPPYSHEQIDDKESLRRGMGGAAVRYRRINEGWRQTINLNPGSDDSLYLQGLYNAGAVISASYVTLGTLEGAVFSEGVMVRCKSVSRAGPALGDDTFVIEYNIGAQT